MTKDEALKLALEALEYEADKGNDNAYQRERDAIKQALAAPVQEPVAWAVIGDGDWGEWVIGNQFEVSKKPNPEYWKGRGYTLVPLYTTPPAAQPAPSKYGSPELQAMIVARAIEKDRAAQPAPVQEPRKISDFPELQSVVRKGLADGSLTIQGAAPVQEWMKPHPKCDQSCLFQCTKGFTQFPECATTQPAAKRQWVGLTNDEINEFAAGCHLGNSVQGAIYKAEAKLKEKNT